MLVTSRFDRLGGIRSLSLFFALARFRPLPLAWWFRITLPYEGSLVLVPLTRCNSLSLNEIRVQARSEKN